MTDMVEKVGRALADVNELDYDEFPEQHNALARAAIEAMREADNDMLEAMHNAMFVDKFDASNLPMLGAGFEAAIDSALSQPKTGD